MSQSVHPRIEARRDQMFPVLEAAEIGRLWRFGELKSYAAGERIVATGEIAPGAFVILAGRVDVTQNGGLGHSQLIVTHGPGSFMGELAQLSDRPSLVDAYAKEAVEALVIPPRRLRDLMVEEAELGERIMRALILRRVSLLDVGAGGPVIVGSADHADVLRLEGFLTRNGHPHQRFDPKTDPCAHRRLCRPQVQVRAILSPSMLRLPRIASRDLLQLIVEQREYAIRRCRLLFATFFVEHIHFGALTSIFHEHAILFVLLFVATTPELEA